MALRRRPDERRNKTVAIGQELATAYGKLFREAAERILKAPIEQVEAEIKARRRALVSGDLTELDEVQKMTAAYHRSSFKDMLGDRWSDKAVDKFYGRYGFDPLDFVYVHEEKAGMFAQLNPDSWGVTLGAKRAKGLFE